MKRKAPPSPREAAKRAALKAIGRARRAADKAGVPLSEWEGEFLQSVGERLNTYGRAFADPDKGPGGGALSARQGVKLKEIAAKACGKGARRPKAGPGLRRRQGLARKSLVDAGD
jgi:hypothetical protein